MRILLDTCAFLWFIGDNPRISTAARTLIENRENEIFISKASLWEMALKHSKGLLPLKTSFRDAILNEIDSNDFRVLRIRRRHIEYNSTMAFTKVPPKNDEHKDPFDRMILAQAITEDLPIITDDDLFPLYPVTVLW